MRFVIEMFCAVRRFLSSLLGNRAVSPDESVSQTPAISESTTESPTSLSRLLTEERAKSANFEATPANSVSESVSSEVPAVDKILQPLKMPQSPAVIAQPSAHPIESRPEDNPAGLRLRSDRAQPKSPPNFPMSSAAHEKFSRSVGEMHSALTKLAANAELLAIDPLEGREWYEILRQKLLPQLVDDSFLVVAVVGGTNIGKSVIFNHIAGCRASATSPLATGTKHPVCLVPRGFEDRHDLAAIFHGFSLEAWSQPEAALEEREEHTLFWRTDDTMPANLLVLDTPDIDSDAPVNWLRADGIRRCADVLIAVLTQQKYNDAAVKRFFRKAAEEDKAVVIVFNQCLLPEDEDYWPVWLNTFTSETGVQPELLYVAPNDRRAAEENRLEFLERPASPDAPPVDDPAQPRSLSDDLSRLRFDDIKLRTLRGSLQHLVGESTGVPTWLNEVRRRSGEFASAAERLSSDSVVRIKDWPGIGNHLLVSEVRAWWKARQQGWAKSISGFYDTLGKAITVPYTFARNTIQGEPPDPLQEYHEKEWAAILHTVEEIYDKLSWMTEAGSQLLRPRLEQLLSGTSRTDLLEKLRADHEQVDLSIELEQTVNSEMTAFQAGSPEMYQFYRQLHNISAAVRPMTSVVLFSMGWGPAGEAVAPFVADAAAHAVVPIVADLAGGATAAVAGEAAVAGTAGSSAGFLQAKFQKLQSSFTSRRVSWLATALREELLGTLPDELKTAASLPDSEPFAAILQQLKNIETELASDLHVGT